VIEPTDEMVQIMKRLDWTESSTSQEIRRALAAVLAIVERDYRIEPKPPWEREAAKGWPTTRCGARGFASGPGCIRRAGHEGGHGYSDGSGEQDPS
jgi:hypothetical protein